MRRLNLAAVAIAAATVVGPGHAADHSDGVAEATYVVKTFAIADRGDLPGKLVDATVSLIGTPTATTFGLSYQGTLTPKVEMTGKETLTIYLYIDCDDKSPTGTRAINVGKVDIGTLKRGREVSTMRGTTDAAAALVPLSDIECATLEIGTGDPAGEVADGSYIVKTLAIPDPGDLPDLKLGDATASLIGQPDSMSFGLSFRGTLTPEVAMTGEEKLVLYLYINCDDEIPSKTKGINVATVDIGSLKSGRRVSTLIATKDASAFAPLSQIGCAKIAID